jgi:LacI family transcriptional regulator
MGYRPNPLVSALIRSRRDPHRRKYHATLGYLLPLWPGGATAYREDYRQMMDGAAAAAADFGYRLEFISLDSSAGDVRRMTEILGARNIAGLIIPPLHTASSEIGVEWSRWPVVAIGFSQRISVPRVAHDHGRAVRSAVSQLIAAERTRVGLVLPRRVSDKVEGRWVAAFLHERSVQRPGLLVPPLLLDETDDQAVFGRWAKRHRPDAIIGLQHQTPIRRWLRERGWRGGRDVMLVTLDARPSGEQCAGIDQDYAALGGVAVEQLVNRIERRGIALRSVANFIVMVEGSWRD